VAASTGGWHQLSAFKPLPTFPRAGVYFFVEPGEYRSGSRDSRITRVGTHRVREGSQQALWPRLRQHRGTADGTGGHRAGSIFRFHVGLAILARDGAPAPWLASRETRRESITEWGRRLGAADASSSDQLYEQAISSFIGRTRFTYVAISDVSSKRSDRAFIERNAIGLLAVIGRRVDPPSPGWLGQYSPKAQVASTGLWNMDHVNAPYDSRFLEVFETYAGATCGVCTPPSGSIAPTGWI